MRKVLFVGEFIPQYRKDFFFLSKEIVSLINVLKI